jgi:AraC-like DNA-binding protein
MSHVSILFSSPVLEVSDAVCTMGKSGKSTPRGEGGSHLALIRRGCFDYHLGARSYFADNCKALIYDEGAEYRTSHPCDGGDDCTIVNLADDLMGEIFGRRRKHEHVEFHMSPAAQLAHLAAYAVLRHPDTDTLTAEEVSLGLIHTLARQRPLGDGTGRAAARQRRIMDGVKALLNERMDENLSLAVLAREVACSPYHLMHLFRAETGQPIRRYRSQLRVAAALERLVEGADDLTELALHCGFSSHSHLTDTFKAVLGLTPSELRQRFGHEALAEKRSLLEAALRRAA